MTDESLFIAVDLGAGSGRVFLADLAPDKLNLEPVRRFTYNPRHEDGHLRWDLRLIFDEIKAGLFDAGRRASELGRRIVSAGVDSWGVDYGLIDPSGKLIENPICYRDHRTRGAKEQVFVQLSADDIFNRTGIQFLDFNTLFQLFAHARAGISDRATRLLMIPDLINSLLSGAAVTEYTNATTTQMVNVQSKTWDVEMLGLLDLPCNLLPELVPAGSELGLLRRSLQNELQLDGMPLIAPATHDTGSAVAGTPLSDGWAFISSGTWSLVGIERTRPLISAEVARSNFTNEGGVFGTIRFLKNVMGLWILECCRKEWSETGSSADYDSLLKEVSSLERGQIIFPDDPRFFNPPVMIDAIAEQLVETGFDERPQSSDRVLIVRCILDSLALRYASVLRTIESLTGEKIKGVHIVGGGSQNEYLNQATANATGLQVMAGPVEATVIGNVMVQAIARGCFSSLADARQHVSSHARVRVYDPKPTRNWELAAQRYAEIEQLYL